MKKLLNLLIITIFGIGIFIIFFVFTTKELIKKDVFYHNLNNYYLPIKKIDNINAKITSIAIDNLNNIYFGNDNGLFVLKKDQTIPIKINGIDELVFTIAIDNYNNVYFGTKNNAFVLKNEKTTPIKIDGIDENISSIVIDYLKNDVYISSNFKIYNLIYGETKANIISHNFIEKINSISINKNYELIIGTKNGAFFPNKNKEKSVKINGLEGEIKNITFNNQSDVYFTKKNVLYLLKKNKNVSTKIFEATNDIVSITLGSNGNIYFCTNNFAYVLQNTLTWLKEQIKFNLLDNNKKEKWLEENLISINGEINIEIANNNINKILLNNIEQTQIEKKWIINIKPENIKKEYILNITFNLNNEQYVHEIIIFMQKKIDKSSKQKIKENLNDIIKFANENNLGDIFNNNNETLVLAINQINNHQIDFSQIDFKEKNNNSIVLTAKEDSDDYIGTTKIKYNILPYSAVSNIELKIDLIPISKETIVLKDYIGQINSESMTNEINKFYYANDKTRIKIINSNLGIETFGKLFGCNDDWTKNSKVLFFEQINSLILDGTQLNATNGKYIIELFDKYGIKNNIYLQISSKQEIKNFFDTDNGKKFEIWAKSNKNNNIRNISVNKLNNLFKESKSWIKLANDSELANNIANWYKDNINIDLKKIFTKKQIINELEQKIPKNITINNLDASNYDYNKISFEINEDELKRNNVLNINIKYNSQKSNNITLQSKNNSILNTIKNKITGWGIVGIIIGSLFGLMIISLLFKKFVINPFILKRNNKK